MTAINYHKIAELPAIVRSFCYSHEAWIVGSYAEYLLDITQTKPKDVDLLIPFYHWGIASKAFPVNTPTNSHGGIKLTTQEVIMDIWAGDIGWFLAQVPKQPANAIQPSTMTHLVTNKQVTRTKEK